MNTPRINEILTEWESYVDDFVEKHVGHARGHSYSGYDALSNPLPIETEKPSPEMVALREEAGDQLARYAEGSAERIKQLLLEHPLFAAMARHGNFEPTGAIPIIELFTFAENSSAGSYSGYVLPKETQLVVSGAQFDLKQYAVPVALSDRELLINNSDAQRKDLVRSRVVVAEAKMVSLLLKHVMQDGTGNDGKDLTGLKALLADPRYGGIDRSNGANAFWRPKKFVSGLKAGAPATAATIQSHWNNLIIQLTRGSDRPDLILAGPNVAAKFKASPAGFSKEETADGQWTFHGIPVIDDMHIDPDEAYFLNTKYLKFRTHKDRPFNVLDNKAYEGSTGAVKTLAWAGNLTCSGAQFQGLFVDKPASTKHFSIEEIAKAFGVWAYRGQPALAADDAFNKQLVIFARALLEAA